MIRYDELTPLGKEILHFVAIIGFIAILGFVGYVEGMY